MPRGKAGLCSGKIRLGFNVTANLYVMPTHARVSYFYQGKCALQEMIPRGPCLCKFSFVPKPGRRPNVSKGAL